LVEGGLGSPGKDGGRVKVRYTPLLNASVERDERSGLDQENRTDTVSVVKFEVRCILPELTLRLPIKAWSCRNSTRHLR
jgi:hypothetical protein